jgi:hypothetical protein
VRWYTVVRFLAGLGATQHQLADELEPEDRKSTDERFAGGTNPLAGRAMYAVRTADKML